MQWTLPQLTDSAQLSKLEIQTLTLSACMCVISCYHVPKVLRNQFNQGLVLIVQKGNISIVLNKHVRHKGYAYVNKYNEICTQTHFISSTCLKEANKTSFMIFRVQIHLL
jgi:hypothetical protein